MFTDNIDSDLIVETKNTLDRIKKAKNYKKDLHQVIKENKDRYDIGRHFFEEYDVNTFKTKLHVDTLFMEQLTQKLDQDQSLQVEELLIGLFNNVREIYEFINIEPEIFGKFDESLLNESEESIKNKLSKKIYSFLENKYYGLSIEKRNEKYKDRVQPTSQKLIAEGVEIKEAVTYSIKECLMEDLIADISFPFAVKSRLDFLLENEAYAEIFDQDRLKKLYEDFETKKRGIAKITAACV